MGKMRFFLVKRQFSQIRQIMISFVQYYLDSWSGSTRALGINGDKRPHFSLVPCPKLNTLFMVSSTLGCRQWGRVGLPGSQRVPRHVPYPGHLGERCWSSPFGCGPLHFYPLRGRTFFGLGKAAGRRGWPPLGYWVAAYNRRPWEQTPSPGQASARHEIGWPVQLIQPQSEGRSNWPFTRSSAFSVSANGGRCPEIIERDAQSGNWACKSWDCFDYWDDDKSAKKVPSPIWDSNPRPLAWQSSLLTTIPRRFTYFECSHTTIYRALPSSHYTLALLGPRWRGISILRCSVKVHELLFLILTRNHRFLWSEMSIKHSRCVAFKCQVNF